MNIDEHFMRLQMNKGPTGPNALHCDVCDIPLTSLQHANQHNMGRKHKKYVRLSEKNLSSIFQQIWLRLYI